jgi:hypothetical protein
VDNTEVLNLRPRGRSCATFILGCALCCVTSAQQISVRLLDGKSGKPKSKFRVYIVLGDPKFQHTLDLTSNRQGYVHFESSAEKTFQVRPVGTVSLAFLIV